MSILGIDGLTDRGTEAAVLRVGESELRNGRVLPVKKDRFSFCDPSKDSTGIRPLATEFAPFNTAPAAHRRVVQGVLVRAAIEDCHESKRFAYRLPGRGRHEEPPPGGMPECSGTVATGARRWVNGEWRDIPCPGDLCPYAQENDRGARPCKPRVHLWFQPVWRKEGVMPSPLVRFTTQAWNTTAQLNSFFRFIDSQARELGVAANVYGLTFQLKLEEHTRTGSNGKPGRRFPVVRFTATGEVQTLLLANGQRRHEIAQQVAAGLIAGPVAEPADLGDVVDVDAEPVALGGA